jgi:Rieske Fe-S protein
MSALRAYLSPPEAIHGSTVVLGAVDNVVADGARAEVQVSGRSMLVARRGMEVVALDLTCTHAACPLEVDLAGARIRCRCHGGAFDLEGRPVQAPPRSPLVRYPATVVDGVLYIQIPPRSAA